MSRIDDMLQELCPEGVEMVELGLVASYSASRVAASDVDSTSFVGVDNLIAGKRGRVDATHSPNTDSLTGYLPGDILLGNIRPYLKKVWLADRQGGCGGDVLAIRLNDDGARRVDVRFLYYLISSDSFFLFDQQNAKGAKMPRGDKAAIMRYRIPLAPLAIQHEVVRVLDQFTQLEAELEAELEARRQQYSYYLEDILGPHRWSEVPWMPLASLGTFRRGKRFTKSDYANEGIPCIHYGEIYTRFGVSASAVASYLDDSIAGKLRFADPGDLIIVDVGEVVDDVGRSVAWVGDESVAIHDHSYAFRGDMNPVFLSYVMRTSWFRRQKSKHVARTKVKTLLLEGFSRICVPVPSIAEQERTVEILNEFDALVNDLSSGLPAEIEARRQQYEYYRDRLLAFPEKR